MLFEQMEMNPAKLLSLEIAAKKAKYGSEIDEIDSSSSASVSAPRPDDGGNISDTDNVELHAAANPIGDLLALCDTSEWEDPDYSVNLYL